MSQKHGKTDLLQDVLHPPLGGVSQDEISRELQLMCFTPLSGNTCKSQYEKTEMETQLLSRLKIHFAR